MAFWNRKKQPDPVLAASVSDKLKTIVQAAAENAAATARKEVIASWSHLQPIEDREPDAWQPQAYLDQVRDGFDLYLNRKEHGCAAYRTGVGFLANHQFDNQFELNVSAGGETETEWLEEFIKLNKLRGENGSKASVYGVIQGQAMLEIEPVEKDDVPAFIRLRVTPLIPLDGDLLTHNNVNYQMTAEGERVIVNSVSGGVGFYNPTTFELVKLVSIWSYSKDNLVLETISLMAANAKYCILKDRALEQQDEILQLCNPVAVTVHPSDNARNEWYGWLKEQMGTALGKIKWSIGKMLGFATDAVKEPFYYSQADPEATEGLRKEQEDCARNLYANTGTSSSKFGWPDHMSSRSVQAEADDWALTDQQRKAWESGIYEILRKAMEMHNSRGMGEPLKIEKFEGVTMNTLPPGLALAFQGILFKDMEKNFIDLETYLSKHPGISNGEDVAKKVLGKQREDAAELARQIEAERARQEAAGRGEGGDDDD